MYSGSPCDFRKWTTALDLGVGDEGAVDAGDPAAGRHVQHVALAEQLLRALLAEDGPAVDLGGDLEADAGREVGLDRAGDDVDRRALRRHDQVDAGGPRHLRQALDRGFDVLAGDHHQVRHLVDDDDDQRQRREVERLLLEDRLAGSSSKPVWTRRVSVSPLRRASSMRCVEAGDVAHAELRHRPVALLHLAHRPFQRDHRLPGLGDHRRQQMRDAVVDRKLQHLRVDHDEAGTRSGDSR